MGQRASLVDGVQGGMLDDMDVLIVSAVTGEYTYPNTSTTINALILTLRTDDGTEHVEGLSSGKAIPTSDGTGFENKLDVKAKAKQFIDSMIALQYPGIDDSVKVFDGAKIHVNRKALPKMSGIDKEGDRDKTVLLATKIVALPGKGKTARPTTSSLAGAARPATSSSAGAGTAAQTAESNGDLNAVAVGAIVAILKQQPLDENGVHSITRTSLATKVMFHLAKDKVNMAPAKKLASDANWLQAQSEIHQKWVVDGENVIGAPE